MTETFLDMKLHMNKIEVLRGMEIESYRKFMLILDSKLGKSTEKDVKALFELTNELELSIRAYNTKFKRVSESVTLNQRGYLECLHIQAMYNSLSVPTLFDSMLKTLNGLKKEVLFNIDDSEYQRLSPKIFTFGSKLDNIIEKNKQLEVTSKIVKDMLVNRQVRRYKIKLTTGVVTSYNSLKESMNRVTHLSNRVKDLSKLKESVKVLPSHKETRADGYIYEGETLEEEVFNLKRHLNSINITLAQEVIERANLGVLLNKMYDEIKNVIKKDRLDEDCDTVLLKELKEIKKIIKRKKKENEQQD